MALVLTRRVGESIVIDEDITVTILSILGRQVRIAIQAPDDVPINREEIQRKIWQERGDEYLVSE